MDMDASPAGDRSLLARLPLNSASRHAHRCGRAIWASFSTYLFVTSAAFAQSPAGGSATIIPLNQANAQSILSYGAMACAAYVDCTATNYLASGYKQDLSWQDVLRQAAPGRDISSTIKIFEQAGFSATI